MGRMRILWQNLHPGASLTVSSEDPDWPASFLLIHWPGLRHRTTGDSDEWWKWDLGSAKLVSYLALWGHNFTAGATITVQANNSDSWGSPALSIPASRYSDYIVANPEGTYRWWRLSVQDAANPAGYLEAGWPYLGGFFEPRYSFAARRRSLRDRSERIYSVGGQFVAVVRDRYAAPVYDFDGVLDSDRTALEAIYKEIGEHKPYFLLEDSDDQSTLRYVVNTAPWSFEPKAYGMAWRFTLDSEDVR